MTFHEKTRLVGFCMLSFAAGMAAAALITIWWGAI